MVPVSMFLVCVYVCMCVYVYTSIYIYIYIYVCMYACTGMFGTWVDRVCSTTHYGLRNFGRGIIIRQ